MPVPCDKLTFVFFIFFGNVLKEACHLNGPVIAFSGEVGNGSFTYFTRCMFVNIEGIKGNVCMKPQG